MRTLREVRIVLHTGLGKCFLEKYFFLFLFFFTIRGFQNEL